MHRNNRPVGLGSLFFVCGIFTALVCPLWVIAAIEGIIIIVFVITCCKR